LPQKFVVGALSDPPARLFFAFVDVIFIRIVADASPPYGDVEGALTESRGTGN